MQSHLSTLFPSAQQYEVALAKFATIGCDIQVTELDITVEDGYTFNDQSKLYGELFQLYKKYKNNISLVALWGTNDEISWRAKGKPLIFTNYQPKGAYDKIIEGMKMPTDVKNISTGGIIVTPTLTNEETTIYCDGSFSYRLSNLVGKTIKAGEGKDQLNIKLNIPNGIYMLEVSAKSAQKSVVRIIKR